MARLRSAERNHRNTLDLFHMCTLIPLEFLLRLEFCNSPITTTFPASAYWGIDQSVRYGPNPTILAKTAGIVDTGTTLLLFATGLAFSFPPCGSTDQSDVQKMPL